MVFLSTKSVPIVIAIATGMQMIALFTKPAMMKFTKLIAATVIAYGSCVDTWSRWLTLAPAEAMMVVSEMGEQ